MLVNASAGLRELRVLHGPQGYERTDRVELQALSVMPGLDAITHATLRPACLMSSECETCHL